MIGVIVATSLNKVIGNQGKLPWYLPEDLAHFKQVTLNQTVVMGRKTWESLPIAVRPLPDRTNIVVTTQVDYKAEGAIVVNNLFEAVKNAKQTTDVLIIGGATIYENVKNIVDYLWITTIHGHFNGDVFLPEYLDNQSTGFDERWRLCKESKFTEEFSESGVGYSIRKYILK